MCIKYLVDHKCHHQPVPLKSTTLPCGVRVTTGSDPCPRFEEITIESDNACQACDAKFSQLMIDVMERQAARQPGERGWTDLDIELSRREEEDLNAWCEDQDLRGWRMDLLPLVGGRHGEAGWRELSAEQSARRDTVRVYNGKVQVKL